MCASLALGAVVLLGAASDPLPRATPEAAGLAPAPLREATDLLRQFVADHKIAGAVAAVARHGKLAYLEPVGWQDVEAKAPMTDRSLFRIYSMTKSVTAVAAMMLFEEGRFSLADPVSKYLPEFRQSWSSRPPTRRRGVPRARSRWRICCCTRRASAIARPSSTRARRCARAGSRCRRSSRTSCARR
jgi:CubicO group peptidase (beta-lactamase class C family)